MRSRTPAQLAKMHCQRNRRQPPRRRRAAAHPQRNPVVHLDRQRHNRPIVAPPASPCRSPESDCLRAVRSAPHLGPSRQSKTPPPAPLPSPDKNPAPPQPRRIPAPDSPKLPAGAAAALRRHGLHWLAHPALPFIAASTAAGVASTTTALRRSAPISASLPADSSSVSSVPRWKSIV